MVVAALMLMAFVGVVPAAGPGFPGASSQVGVGVSGFLPAVTGEASLRLELTPRWAWGGAIAGFYALGRSVHAEVFLEPVYLATMRWRLSSRLGLLAGWNQEFSFGPPPQWFPGAGMHLQLIEAQWHPGAWYLGLASGIRVLTDFRRIAGTFYLGFTVGAVLHDT